MSGSVGVLSTIGASVIATLPTDPATIEALAKWPAVMALAAVSIYSIYSMNRNADRTSKSIDRQSDAIQKLAGNLSQRPCIRHPGNN